MRAARAAPLSEDGAVAVTPAQPSYAFADTFADSLALLKLSREPGSPDCTAVVDYATAGFGFHTRAETVRAGAAFGGGLIGTLHERAKEREKARD
jgi:hypothetical protein